MLCSQTWRRDPQWPQILVAGGIPLCPLYHICRAQRACWANQRTWLPLFYSFPPITCLEQSPEDSFKQQRGQNLKPHLSRFCEGSCLKSPRTARSEIVVPPLCSWARGPLDPELPCALPLRLGSESWVPAQRVIQCPCRSKSTSPFSVTDPESYVFTSSFPAPC